MDRHPTVFARISGDLRRYVIDVAALTGIAPTTEVRVMLRKSDWAPVTATRAHHATGGHGLLRTEERLIGYLTPVQLKANALLHTNRIEVWKSAFSKQIRTRTGEIISAAEWAEQAEAERQRRLAVEEKRKRDADIAEEIKRTRTARLFDRGDPNCRMECTPMDAWRGYGPGKLYPYRVWSDMEINEDYPTTVIKEWYGDRAAQELSSTQSMMFWYSREGKEIKEQREADKEAEERERYRAETMMKVNYVWRWVKKHLETGAPLHAEYMPCIKDAFEQLNDFNIPAWTELYWRVDKEEFEERCRLTRVPRYCGPTW